MLQCKSICHSRVQIFLMLTSDHQKALPWFSFYCAAPVRTGKRFCGIKALIKQSLFCLFPVHFPGLFIKCVISCVIIKQITRIKKFLVIFTAGIHVWPYRNHGVCMHFMNSVHTFLIIPITRLIQNFLTPVARIPCIPVLNHTVQRNIKFSVVTDDFLQLFRCIILLL